MQAMIKWLNKTITENFVNYFICATCKRPKTIFHNKYSGRGTPRKMWWGCMPHFPKPLSYLSPKSVTFPTLFITWPKIWYPIKDHCSWHGWCRHSLWRTFFDGLIDNDEKVASSKQKYSKTRVQNQYPIYDQNGWKTILLGAPHVREYPLPESRLLFNLLLSQGVEEFLLNE